MEDFKSVANMLPKHTSNNSINMDELFVKRFNKSVVTSKYGNCPLCGNKGQIAVLEKGKAIIKSCKCYSIRRAREKLEKVGLFEILRQFPNIDSLTENENWEKIVNNQLRDYLANHEMKYWLYLGGQNGCGKTTKGTLAFYTIIKQNTDVTIDYFLWDVNWQSLLPRKKDPDNMSPDMESLIEADVLYIDDFLRHRDGNKMSNYERDIAKQLIDYRYRHNKLTIISSELLYNELKELDEAIATRIYEKCKKSKYVLSIGRDSNRNYREREEE